MLAAHVLTGLLLTTAFGVRSSKSSVDNAGFWPRRGPELLRRLAAHYSPGVGMAQKAAEKLLAVSICLILSIPYNAAKPKEGSDCDVSDNTWYPLPASIHHFLFCHRTLG